MSATKPPPFNNPFAQALPSLKEKLGDLPEGKRPSALDESQKGPAAKGPARAVVRLERKGHGGKEVTLVEKLELGPDEAEKWLKHLKQHLGCGGSVVEEGLMFQGDQRERLRPLLIARGVRKVTVG